MYVPDAQLRTSRPDWYERSRPGMAGKHGQSQEQDIVGNGIVYFKQDGNTTVRDEPVDQDKARTEIQSLGCGQDNHFIGFKNLRTAELLQFLRFEQDLWYADVPIQHRTGWDGYVWGCRTDLESVLNTANLFIDGAPWFHSLKFTMRRVSAR